MLPAPGLLHGPLAKPGRPHIKRPTGPLVLGLHGPQPLKEFCRLQHHPGFYFGPADKDQLDAVLAGGHGKANNEVFCAARCQLYRRGIALGQAGRELLGGQGRLANFSASLGATLALAS